MFWAVIGVGVRVRARLRVWARVGLGSGPLTGALLTQIHSRIAIADALATCVLAVYQPQIAWDRGALQLAIFNTVREGSRGERI